VTELVLQAQKGDRAAFQQLYQMYQHEARAVALVLLPSDQVAQAVQETFLFVWKKLPQLEEPERFLGWLSLLVLKICDGHEPITTSQDELKALREALQALSLRDRNLLILGEFGGLEVRDLSYATLLPPKAVVALLPLARKRLEEKLGGGCSLVEVRVGR